VVVACGPFSVKEDDISLKKLIDYAVRFNANAMILVFFVSHICFFI
jgi:hypothetical protein